MKRKIILPIAALLLVLLVAPPSFATPPPPCPCCEKTDTDYCIPHSCSTPVSLVDGGVIVHQDGPSLGMFNLDLTYSSYTDKWTTSLDAHLTKYGQTRVVCYSSSEYSIDFRYYNSEWQVFGLYAPTDSNWSITGALDGEMTVTHTTDSGNTVYRFNGPEHATEPPGKITCFAYGDPDDANNKAKLTYVYSGGVLSYIEDGYGRQVHFEFSVGGNLVKIIEPNPAAALPKENLYGRITLLSWTSNMLDSITIGMPKTNQPDHTDIDDYTTRTTAFVYESNRLAYVILPDQYDAWRADQDPPTNVASYAAQIFTYYTSGVNTGKVETQSSCTSCGGGGTKRYEYVVGDLNEICNETRPGGVGLTTPDQPHYQTTLFSGSGGSEHPTAIYQMNQNGQTVAELLRVATGTDDDKTGWLKQYFYTELYQLEYVVESEVVFQTDPPGEEDGWTHLADAKVQSWTQKTGLKYVRNEDDQITGEYIWDGEGYAIQVKAVEYPTGKTQPFSEERSIDGDNSVISYFYYDTNGHMILQVEPAISSGQNGYNDGGEGHSGAYMLGTRTTYDNYGRVKEVRKVRLTVQETAPQPGQNPWSDPEDDEAILSVTAYAYADDDPSEGGLGSASCFELVKLAQEDAEVRTNAEHPVAVRSVSQFTYAIVAGMWRRTAEVADADGTALTTLYSYDGDSGAFGNPTLITEPGGVYTTSITYDELDRVTCRERKLSGSTVSKEEYVFSMGGQIIEEKRYEATSTTSSTVYTYDGAGRRSEIYEDVLDFTGTYPVTGCRGNITQYTYYDGTDLIEAISQKAGWSDGSFTQIVSYKYTSDGKQSEVVREGAPDTTTIYTYYDAIEENGRLYGYLKMAEEKVEATLTNYSTYEYDWLGRQVRAKRYDEEGENDVLLSDSETVYDAMGRAYQTIVHSLDTQNPGAITTNYYYDELGQLLQTVDDDSTVVAKYTYDNLGRALSTEDALGNVSFTSYDGAGRVASREMRHKVDTDVYRSEWSYLAYDAAGRLASVTNYGPTNIVTTYAYGFDATDGQYSQVTDPDGRVTKSFVDLLGRTTKTVEDSGDTNRTTLYAYSAEEKDGDDVIGYMDTITAENGAQDDQTTGYLRGDIADAQRVTKITYPDAGAVAFTYNTDGSLATRTDQRGWTTTYTRALDNGQLMVTESVAGTGLVGTTQIVYKYDGLGRLTSVTDNNGSGPDSEVTYAYAWSGTDQTVTEAQDINSEGPWDVESTYTKLGVRESLEYPNSRTLGFTYDALRRLDTITQSSATLADYEYKGLYLNQRGLGGAIGADVVRLSFEQTAPLDGYDAWGRVTWLRNYAVSGGDNIARYAYGYSYASEIKYQENLSLDLTDHDELYGYDNLHRLTSFKRGTLNANKDDITGTPDRQQSWTLDHVGNWENPSGLAIDSDDNGNPGTPSDERTHNSVNEVTTIDPEGAVGSFNVTHDDAGNLSILPDRANPTTTADCFTYDYRNRLIKVEHTTTYDQQPPTWNTVVQYFYDGLNRRVKKDLTSGTDVIYLYDGWQCIEEREDDGGTWEARRQYVYGGRYIDEPLIFDKDYDSDGICTDFNYGGSRGAHRYYYAQQVNYNVTAMVVDDGDGSVTFIEWAEYDPYGAATVTIADGQSATGNPYLFQGRRWEEEAGLYYFRNRWYSAELGRFLQRDPAGYVDGMGLYRAVRDNPISLTDPSGALSHIDRKILAIYARRFATGGGGSVGYLKDWLFGKTYEIEDTLGELPDDLWFDMEVFYIRYLKEKKLPESKWMYVSIDRQNAVDRGEWDTEASYFLNRSAKVMVKGKLQVCRTGEGEFEKFHVKNLDTDWHWHDEIDARTLEDLWKDHGFSIEKPFMSLINFGEGTLDLVVEKTTPIQFFVIVHFTHRVESIEW